MLIFSYPLTLTYRKRSGSVVECLTLDWGAGGSSLTGVTALCPWARHINPSLVLVQPRKTCPYITERLLMGHIESNQTQTLTYVLGAQRTVSLSTSVGLLGGNWLATYIADLQVLLSWGSSVVSFHSRQSFSISFFHVSLGLPAINMYITCCSDCTTRTLDMPKSVKPSLSLKMRLRSSSFASSLLDLTAATSSSLILQIWSWSCHWAVGSSWSMAKFPWHGAWGSPHKSSGFAQTWKVLEYTGLSWKVLEN